MVGQVDDRRRVGARFEIDGEVAAVVERVGRGDGERPRIALIAGRADQPKRDFRDPAGVADLDDLPHMLVEPDRAAVQRVGLVVERQLVGLAVEREAATGNPVGIAADRLAPVIGMRDVARGIVIAERHVGDVPVSIRTIERLQRRAQGHDPRAHSVGAGQDDRLRPESRRAAFRTARASPSRHLLILPLLRRPPVPPSTSSNASSSPL